MRRTLFSIMTLMLVVGLVGGGAFAWFDSTATSTDNSFTAGTMVLAMGPTGGVAGGTVAIGENMAPGVESESYNVYFKNTGSLDGLLTVNVSYSDAGQGDFGDFSGQLVVTQAYVDINGVPLNGAETNVAPYWAQQILDFDPSALANREVVVASNPVGYLPTIYGLSKITLHVWDLSKQDVVIKAGQGLLPGDIVHESFVVKIDENANNSYQGDSVKVTLTATLNQTNFPLPQTP